MIQFKIDQLFRLCVKAAVALSVGFSSTSTFAQSNALIAFVEAYPAEGVELARGWYGTKSIPVARSCVSGDKGDLDSSNLSYTFTELTSRDQIYKALRINAAAQYGAIKGSASFADTFNNERNKRAVLAQVSYRRFGNYLAPLGKSKQIEIDKIYLDKLVKASKSANMEERRTGLREFYEACGDSYVVAIERGGDLLTQFSLETTTEERNTRMSAAISGGAGKFKASLGVTSELKKLMNAEKTSINSTQTGGTPVLASSVQNAYGVLEDFASKITKDNAVPFNVILQPYAAHPDFPANMKFVRTPPKEITYLAELAEKFDELSSTYRVATVGRIAYQYPFQKVQTDSTLCKDLKEEGTPGESCLVAELADESRFTNGIANCIRKVVEWCRDDIICDLSKIPKDLSAAQCLQKMTLDKLVTESNLSPGAISLRKAESDSFVSRIMQATRGNYKEIEGTTVALNVDSLNETYLRKLAELPLVAGNLPDIGDVEIICKKYTAKPEYCTSKLAEIKTDKELQPMNEALRQWTLQERFGKTIGSACSIDPDHPLCNSLVAAVDISQKLIPSFAPPRRFATVSAAPPAPAPIQTPPAVIKEPICKSSGGGGKNRGDGISGCY